MESFSQRLRRLRSEKELSARQMAEKSGIPISTYREWEYGKQIKGEPYEKIAAALDVTLYELLTGRRPNQLEAFRKLEEIESACRSIRNTLEAFFYNDKGVTKDF